MMGSNSWVQQRCTTRLMNRHTRQNRDNTAGVVCRASSCMETMLFVDIAKACLAETAHLGATDNDQRHALATEPIKFLLGPRVFLDIVLDIAHAVLLEVVACFLAVTAPAGRIHDHALVIRRGISTQALVGDALVGIDTHCDLLGRHGIMWLV